MTRMFGVDDEFGEDAILGRLEGMRDVIEQVNRQFKDPVRTLVSYSVLFLFSLNYSRFFLHYCLFLFV